MTDFTTLGLAAPLLRALEAEGFQTATPIQLQAIPPALQGRDLLGLAQTGTGKTAAFALPILQRLSENPKPVVPKAPRALVVAPTRELALQVAANFTSLGCETRIRTLVIHGGVSPGPQAAKIAKGVEVLVATPGRLLDLMSQQQVRLDQVETFVLDEADRMLDMGFIRDVRKIVAALPAKRQNLLFSATMPDDVSDLAGRILKDHVRVEVTPPATTVQRIDQGVIFVDQPQKKRLLSALFQDGSLGQTIVFTRTKHGANKLAQSLQNDGITADAIHGNKSQNARERALEGFRVGTVRALIATDIAARGIDVDSITHVVNFDLPDVPDVYVHRIGRTGRAGRTGAAVAFCAPDEKPLLKLIEKTIRQPVPVATHPAAIRAPGEAPEPAEPPRGNRRAARSRGRGPAMSPSGSAKPVAATARRGTAPSAPGHQTRDAQPAAGRSRTEPRRPNPQPGGVDPNKANPGKTTPAAQHTGAQRTDNRQRPASGTPSGGKLQSPAASGGKGGWIPSEVPGFLKGANQPSLSRGRR